MCCKKRQRALAEEEEVKSPEDSPTASDTAAGGARDLESSGAEETTDGFGLLRHVGRPREAGARASEEVAQHDFRNVLQRRVQRRSAKMALTPFTFHPNR